MTADISESIGHGQPVELAARLYGEWVAWTLGTARGPRGLSWSAGASRQEALVRWGSREAMGVPGFPTLRSKGKTASGTPWGATRTRGPASLLYDLRVKPPVANLSSAGRAGLPSARCNPVRGAIFREWLGARWCVVGCNVGRLLCRANRAYAGPDVVPYASTRGSSPLG